MLLYELIVLIYCLILLLRHANVTGRGKGVRFVVRNEMHAEKLNG